MKQFDSDYNHTHQQFIRSNEPWHCSCSLIDRINSNSYYSPLVLKLKYKFMYRDDKSMTSEFSPLLLIEVTLGKESKLTLSNNNTINK